MLNLNKINTRSPYLVWEQNGKYYFRTDTDILYAITFDPEYAFAEEKAYWFNLSNVNNVKSPRDKKIPLTLISIIEAFFDSEPNVLLYICDTANDQQLQRDRLFYYWFKKYNDASRYVFKSAVLPDDGVYNYLSMIVQNSNPNLQAIIKLFDEQVELFKNNK